MKQIWAAGDGCSLIRLKTAKFVPLRAAARLDAVGMDNRLCAGDL